MARPPYPLIDQSLVGRSIALGEMSAPKKLTAKGYLLTLLQVAGAVHPSFLGRALVSIPWQPPQGLRERKNRRANEKLDGARKITHTNQSQRPDNPGPVHLQWNCSTLTSLPVRIRFGSE